MKHMMSAALLIPLGVATLAACTSSSDPSASASSASASSDAASPPAATSRTRTPPRTASTSSPAAVVTRSAPRHTAATTTSTGSRSTDCLEAQLRATIDPRHVPGNGTLGTDGATKMGVIVDFQNTSKITCKLIGYPGAATVSVAGAQTRQAARTFRGELGGLPAASNIITTVVLAPGHYAAAMIEGVDHERQGAAQAGCADRTPRILVTPPNTRIAVPFDVSWPACYSFDVHPVMVLRDAP